MAKDMEGLIRNVEIPNKSSLKAMNLVKTMPKMLDAADKKREEGDQEKAFVYFMRFIECFQIVRKTSDYARDRN